MCKTFRVLLIVVLCACWANVRTSAAVYALDNNSISTALNASDGTEPRDNWFGNVFTAAAGANLLTRVDFGVYTTTPATVAQVVIYRVTDPGGNPAVGATRIYTQNFTPLTGDGTNAFLQQITLANPVPLAVGDRFLVAIFIPNVIALPPNDVYPFLLDASGVATGTYWGRSTPNTFNLDNLTQVKPIDQVLSPGGWTPGPGHIFIRAVGVSDNRPPVAVCTNVVVSAGEGCVASASIDNGSYDPDGDVITLQQFPPGPYHLGQQNVVLVVTDSKGASNACSAVVTVVDHTPPYIICASNKVVECGAAWTFDPPVAFDNCSATNVYLWVVSTRTNPLCGGSYSATRTWSATDWATNMATCSQTVTVLDTTPPTIVCPSPITVLPQDDQGAVVAYVITASDACSPVAVWATPPSGSVFPIGVTQVQATAMDACSNTSSCTFKVTVVGARGIKSNVLAELTVLRSSLTLDPSFAAKFDAAIEHLQNSLKPEYWIDETHLQPKGGNIALNEEKLAANLLDLIQDAKNCPANPAVLQGFINSILKADRLLAMISIEESAAAGLNPKKIAEDLDQVAKGDAEAAAGRYANAIEHYRNAWRHALQLRLQVAWSADGQAVLKFVGNNSQAYAVEVSTDLVNWTPLGDCRADAAGNVEFADPNAAKLSPRFYRVLEK